MGVQSNFDSSNTGSSNTKAVLNSFFKSEGTILTTADINIQSNFNGSNTFGTMQISSRQVVRAN